MVIAVDFDGTIVEHRYPRIGEEIPFDIVECTGRSAFGRSS